MGGSLNYLVLAVDMLFLHLPEAIRSSTCFHLCLEGCNLIVTYCLSTDQIRCMCDFGTLC